MKKEEIREISSLVEKCCAKHPKRNSVDNKIFLQNILLEYNLSASDWQEVIKECNRRTSQIEKKFLFTKYVIDPLLTLLEYVVIVYTYLFVLLSLFNVYTLPSQILFPDGTYSERDYFVNILNVVIVIIGIFLIYGRVGKKKNK